MSEILNNQNEEMTVDEEVARMRESFAQARFGEYPGIAETRFNKRAALVRSACLKEIEQTDKHLNGEQQIIKLDKDIFLPRLDEMYSAHEKAVQDRLDKANVQLAAAMKKNSVQPGRMAAGVRKSIDAKQDAEVKHLLSTEKQLIKDMEASIKRYIRNAPEGSTVKSSSYSKMFRQTIKDNEESLSLASQYLNARATRMKYEEYEKNGVITEGEKRICAIAKEIEDVAKLRLENFKDYVSFKQEKTILSELNSMGMQQDVLKLRRESEMQLAAIVVPREDPQLILTQRLDRSEEKYYDALRAKRDLVGFHPFKKMALNREIKKAEEEYNRSLARFNKDKEEQDKRPPLTTLEEKERIEKELYSFPVEEIIETPEEELDFSKYKIEAKLPKQLDLGDMLHGQKRTPEPTVKKQDEIQVDKNISELEK